MIAGCQVDRHIGAGEALAQEGNRVRREALVLEQVAGGKERIGLLGLGQLDDAGQRLTPIGPSPAGYLGRRPGERGVEVQVGEMQELHSRASVSEARDSSGVATSHRRAATLQAERSRIGFQTTAASASSRSR